MALRCALYSGKSSCRKLGPCPSSTKAKCGLFLAEDAHEDAGHDEQARSSGIRPNAHTLVGVESRYTKASDPSIR